MSMLLRRMTFGLSLLALAACRILTGRVLFSALLLAYLALALISLAAFLAASAHVQLRASLPETAGKGEDFPLRIRVFGSRWTSCLSLRLQGRAVNLLSGEVLPLTDLTLHSDGSDQSFTLNSPRCGRLRVELQRLCLSDLLGLFSRTVSLNQQASTLILPDTFDVDVELAVHEQSFPDSDDHSPDRPGDDPTELFGIRDYREGDAPRSIHWKLSEKLDRAVVREMSLPVSHAVLLLLDNCPRTSVSPDAACAACEALLSVSQALAGLGVLHQIAWLNRETGEIQLRSIASLDDLFGEQGALLSAQMSKSEIGALPRLLEQAPAEYSHLLVFAAAQLQESDVLDARTTLLVAEPNPENALSCLRDELRRLTV